MRPAFRTALVLLCCTAAVAVGGDPLIDSWFTAGSGRYARVYPTLADEAAGNARTTWSRGQGVQSQPVYAGVHEVSFSDDWVYIRTTGLGSHVMGPWYLDLAKTNLFPNYPSNRATLYRFPRNPVVPTAKTLTGLGAIGYFVDGVAMFDSRDAFSYSVANGADASPGTTYAGDGIWNRDAYVNEGVTFDAANAHQAGPQYHYHANPPALRHQLGDHVDHDPATNSYTENASNPRHSPILGWVRDGHPIYGPYGYSDPLNPHSAVRRMISGHLKRDGSHGSTRLAVTGRTTLPTWAAAAQGRPMSLTSAQFGPPVSSQHPLGHYLEDYDYKGDLGMTQGIDFDLDLHNGRYCVTPEFPGGTYAYFVCIEVDGTPVFPYNIGRTFYGSPTGSSVTTIAEPVQKHFEGGPEKSEKPESIVVDPASGDATIIWDAVEGADYEIDHSPNLLVWKTMDAGTVAQEDRQITTDAGTAASQASRFYRIRRTGLDPFDTGGFDDTSSPAAALAEITVTLTGGALPPADTGVDPVSLSFNGRPAILVGRPSRHEITLKVDLSGLADGDYPVTASFAGIAGLFSATCSVGGGGPVTNGHNLLLVIVDDWGIDWSPLDNTTPGLVLPKMPELQGLAASGLRFTNAYAQPVCSPTRATILTGRHPFRHGVGNPQSYGTLPASELTLPEIFTAQGSPYRLASFGKWHLGSGQTGPSTTGGWPYFKGTLQGGLPDYLAWTKTSVINGTTAQTDGYSTYATTDQVNDAVEWIGAQGTDPWFCWLALNAPHTPFHEPPASLAPPGGYTAPGDTSNTALYRRMLESMDTEIGRLLRSVDLAKTNVIVIGDNGSPGQVAQAPYGNGRAKDQLYQGGVRVPLLVAGPDVGVPNGSTSGRLVHGVDLFSTILQLAGIDPSLASSNGTAIDSTTLVPILRGSDSLDRCIVVERFGNGAGDGRALVSDDFPDYKLIIFGDRLSTADTPSFEFYQITADPNEQSPLDIAALVGTARAAYDHLVAKDLSLGGGYSDPPVATFQTVYLNLPNPGNPLVPPLIATQGPNTGGALHPISVTIGGKTASFETTVLANGNPASRVNSSGASDRYSVKVTIDPIAAGLGSGSHAMVVTFPGTTPRVYTALNAFVVP